MGCACQTRCQKPMVCATFSPCFWKLSALNRRFQVTTVPLLFGGSRLSESRNVLTDGSIGRIWSRLQKHFDILTDGSRRTAAGWSYMDGPTFVKSPAIRVLRKPCYMQFLLRKTRSPEQSGRRFFSKREPRTECAHLHLRAPRAASRRSARARMFFFYRGRTPIIQIPNSRVCRWRGGALNPGIGRGCSAAPVGQNLGMF